MASYNVRIKKSAAKEIEDLPKKDRQRVVEKIQNLAEDPRPFGVEKLAGSDIKLRIRQGDYRIVYEIDDKERVVVIARVGHRRDVYRRR